jgi:hypothetical protein
VESEQAVAARARLIAAIGDTGRYKQSLWPVDAGQGKAGSLAVEFHQFGIIGEVEAMGRSFATDILVTALGASVAVGAAAATEDETRSHMPLWGMEHMMSGDGGPGGAMPLGHPEGMLDRLDSRLVNMKAELKITPEQATAWEEFAKTVRLSAAAHNGMMLSMREGFKTGSIFDKPLPERLSWDVSQLEARLAQMKSVKAAVDKLYMVLTAEQKLAADDVFLPMMGMGMAPGQHMMRW